MFKDLEIISKQIVKLDKQYENTNTKCVIKLRRMFKRALSLEKRFIKKVRLLYLLMDDKDINSLSKSYFSWAEERVERRHGRIVKNPIARKVRRVIARKGGGKKCLN